MGCKNQNGFTLIELVVVAAIIAILAGILTPMVLDRIEDAKIARVQADVKTIHSAIMLFRKDTGEWPNRDSATTLNATILKSNGDLPLGPNGGPLVGWDISTPILMDDLMVRNGPGNAGWYKTKGAITTSIAWRGPYASIFDADPWGRAYLVNVKDFGAGGVSILIVSAGPDGFVDTQLPRDSVHGSDIGSLLYSVAASPL